MESGAGENYSPAFFYCWDGRKLESRGWKWAENGNKRCLLSQLEILGEKYSIQNFAE
jgi:hypothetical protein